jgi:hypothetical protein
LRWKDASHLCYKSATFNFRMDATLAVI